MKRLTTTELGILILAIALLVIGFISIVWPRDITALHQTGDGLGLQSWTFSEFINKKGSRIYGAIAMIFGGLITSSVFYCRRE